MAVPQVNSGTGGEKMKGIPEDVKSEPGSQQVSLCQNSKQPGNAWWKSEVHCTRAEKWFACVLLLFYFKIPLVANFESEITCLTMTGNFYKIFSYHMLPAKSALAASKISCRNSFVSLQMSQTVVGFVFLYSYPRRIHFQQTERRPCPRY